MTRGQVETRASVDPVFKAALMDLCERRDIAWTRATDPTAFVWTGAIERQLVKRYIDTGLLEQARNELGIAASDYQTHLRDSKELSVMITEARPLARQTLRERSEVAANSGNDRLLKILEGEIVDDDNFMTLRDGHRVPKYVDSNQARRELAALLENLDKQLAQQVALGKVKRAPGTAAPEPSGDSDSDTNENGKP